MSDILEIKCAGRRRLSKKNKGKLCNSTKIIEVGPKDWWCWRCESCSPAVYIPENVDVTEDNVSNFQVAFPEDE